MYWYRFSQGYIKSNSEYEVKIDPEKGENDIIFLKTVDRNKFGFQGFQKEKINIKN